MIIREDKRGEAFGREAVCLASALAFVFFKNQFEVGDDEKAPVHRFSATALDSNARSIQLITQIGLKYMRPLTKDENYSDDPRGLYGIAAQEVEGVLSKKIDMTKFNWKVTEIG